jgi:hypothetical protein
MSRPTTKPCSRPGCDGTMIQKTIRPFSPFDIGAPLRAYEGWECQAPGCWHVERLASQDLYNKKTSPP